MALSFIALKTEFLVVRHRVLNHTRLRLEDEVAQCLRYQSQAGTRTIVPCVEGDLTQVHKRGEIFLSHWDSPLISNWDYKKWRKEGKATPLKEVLDKYARFKADSPWQPLRICLELKLQNSSETIYTTIELLRKYDLTGNDVYFDSFFGSKLDIADAAMNDFGVKFSKSWHAVLMLGKRCFAVPIVGSRPQLGYDVLTIPYRQALSKAVPGKANVAWISTAVLPNTPIIYGAVTSPDIFAAIVADERSVGAYARFTERGIYDLLLTNFTNRLQDTLVFAASPSLEQLSPPLSRVA